MPAYRKKVFINCPFDNEYRPLLNSLLFTILYLGFEPDISETKSSSDIRIQNIKKLIRDSDFGIHDISRCRIKGKKDLPRFNMPFELGLDMGCLEYGNTRQKNKKILILEKEKFYYQKILSDIAGQDIRDHSDDPQIIIEIIRNWFSTLNIKKKYAGPNNIWTAFINFNSTLSKILKNEEYNNDQIMKLPLTDFIDYAKEWINKFKKVGK